MTQTYQSNYKSYLTQSLSASGTTAYLQTVPTVTEGRLLLSNGNIKEWVSFTGVSGSTVTGLTRWLSQTADPATAGTGLEWGAGTQVILVAMHDQLADKNEDTAFWGTVSAPDISFTGTTTGGLKVKSLTTTQRDALSSPWNGTIIYNSTAWEFQIRQGGAWSTMASGSTQPNASTTVAGKKEDPTDAESIAGTDVGGTGATMSPTCSQVAKNTQSGTFVYGTDVGGDDTYVVALTPAMTTYTNGSRPEFTPSTTNTWACTVDFWAGALNIKTKDGNDPQSGVIRAGKPVTGTILSGQYILDNEDFATTTNKGVAQLATDTTTKALSSTTEVVTPSNLASLNLVRKVFVDVVPTGTSVTNATTTVFTWTVPANLFGSDTCMKIYGSFAHSGNVWSSSRTINIKFWWVTITTFSSSSTSSHVDLSVDCRVIFNSTSGDCNVTAIWNDSTSATGSTVNNIYHTFNRNLSTASLTSDQTFLIEIVSGTNGTWTYYWCAVEKV